MSAYATEVVIGLGGARRAIQLYPPSHPAFNEAMDALVDAVRKATDQGPFVLNLHLGRLYDGSVVIPEDIHGIGSVAEALESRSVESLSFHAGFARKDAVGLVEVLSLKADESLDVDNELAARGVRGVTLTYLAAAERSDGAAGEQSRRRDRELHARLLSTVRVLAEEAASGGVRDLSQTTPIVEQLLNRMMADSAAIMALATIRSRDEHVLYHSLSVMIYTLALGQQLQLPEDGLVRLGVAALLHDIGKSAFDLADPIEVEASITRHPTVGAEILQRLVLEDPSPMLVAFEHHMAPDGSGFPERPGNYIPHPYSRMVSIADRFENLTNPVDGAEPLTPDRAIVRVLREGGHALDPFFVRVFAKALGVFPIGCVVRLSDHTVGIVSRSSDDPLSPVVKLTHDGAGFALADGPQVDLGGGGVRIVEVLPPEALDLNVGEAL